MAYTAVDKHTSFFNFLKYTGNSSTQSVTGVGHQPDLTWIKKGNGSDDWAVFSSVRGVTKDLRLNDSDTEDTATNGLTSFDSDGFSLGDWGLVNQGHIYLSHNWKGGTTSGLSGGTITPSAYSINTTSGFGVYKYTGNGSDNQTITHGLGATPTCAIFKNLDASENWRFHSTTMDSMFTKTLFINTDGGLSSQSDGIKAATSTTITLGNGGAYNTNYQKYVMYLFCDKPGYCKAGSYIGNGVAGTNGGTYVTTGFKPKWVMLKSESANYDWISFYSGLRSSSTGNSVDLVVYPNTNGAWASGDKFDIFANGFRPLISGTEANGDGTKYHYLAFGQSMVGSNNVINTAI